jgi:hypothetical protein
VRAHLSQLVGSARGKEQWGKLDKIQSDRSASRGPEDKLIKNRKIGRVQRQKGRDVCCTVCRGKQCVEHTLPAKLMTPHPGIKKFSGGVCAT